MFVATISCQLTQPLVEMHQSRQDNNEYSRLARKRARQWVSERCKCFRRLHLSPKRSSAAHIQVVVFVCRAQFSVTTAYIHSS